MTASQHRAECVRLLRLALEHANQGGDATPFPSDQSGVYGLIADALFVASRKVATPFKDVETYAQTGEWPDWTDPYRD